MKDKFPELEKIVDVQFTKDSVIENKLAKLYRNQEKIYKLLKLIFDSNSNSPGFTG